MARLLLIHIYTNFSASHLHQLTRLSFFVRKRLKTFSAAFSAVTQGSHLTLDIFQTTFHDVIRTWIVVCTPETEALHESSWIYRRHLAAHVYHCSFQAVCAVLCSLCDDVNSRVCSLPISRGVPLQLWGRADLHVYPGQEWWFWLDKAQRCHPGHKVYTQHWPQRRPHWV